MSCSAACSRSTTRRCYLLAGFASLSVVALALGLRLFALEGCDPAFLARISRLAPVAHYGFMILLVLNLVAGFHALGTLMAVGIMILPAAAARLWVCNLGPLLLIAVLTAFFGSLIGLLLSYYANLPAGTGHRADAWRLLPAVAGNRTDSGRWPAAGGRIGISNAEP
jgi:ABC-type Mn2+/Zn2+ transport system permease subunit